MKRRLLGMGVVAATLMMISTVANAGGVNLSWADCTGEAGALNNKTFACNVNTGTEILVCSFVLDADLPQTSGNEIVVDFISQSSPLPLWFDMKEAGTCRTTALSVDASFNQNDLVCLDWTQGQATAGIGSYNGDITNTTIDPSVQTQHRRLKIAEAVPGDLLQDLTANTDYFTCNIKINHSKTTGAGNCGGCTDPVCIRLNSILCTTPVAANNIFIGQGTSPGSNVVTWQGAGANCAAVPTKNATWGQVKALYR